MLNQLLKISASFLLLLLFFTPTALASGKMEVKLGERVTLQAQDSTVGTYKWVAVKGKDIITTQSNSIFDYIFNQQGEYSVSLTLTAAGGTTKKTTVLVLVGDRYTFSSGSETTSTAGGTLNVPLTVDFETLPAKTPQRSIHILGDEGRVVFDIGTRDDILEYRIDRNIFVDSDGNGIANDDIDNSDHSSYLLGGIWQTKYLASESNKIAAEITVVNKQGQKAKSQVEIIFDHLPAKEGKVVAVLDTLPYMDPETKQIPVYDELDTVAFYSRRSQGDIIEYRIDKNIFVDSDGDGNPANDIDNLNDNSFFTGDVWTTAYDKTDEQIIAQLIVVSKDGTGSRIQREIAFTDRPIVTVIPGTVGSDESIIRLVSDKEFVQKGDPISFSIEGLVQSLDHYVFEWDFNGDGEIDQTVEGLNSVPYIYSVAGIQPVKVVVRDIDGNEANFNLDILVKDIAETTSDFDFSVDKGVVSFTSTSLVSPNLSDKSLRYTWSFGDPDPQNYESQRDQITLQNPVYSYSASGTYMVTLTVVDSDQVSSTKTVEVMIEGLASEDSVLAEGSESDQSADDKKGSIVWTVIKVIFYLVLIVAILMVLIVLGLLAFLKIQHPDLVFEELIDELKIKILGLVGIHEMIETEDHPVHVGMPASFASKTSSDSTPVSEDSQNDTTQASATGFSDEDDEPEAFEPVLAKEDAPVPDWLKNTTPAQVPTSKSEVIEAEVEGESSPNATSENQNAPKKDDASVPDWLKNA